MVEVSVSAIGRHALTSPQYPVLFPTSWFSFQKKTQKNLSFFQLSIFRCVFDYKKKTLKLTITSEEQTLVQQCLRGDPQAQERLYRRYVDAMYNIVVRMVAENSYAEDILQEAFAKVFRSLHTFKGDSTLGAWIKRITINTALNFIRKNGRMPWAELQDNHCVESPRLPKMEDNWDMRRIHEAIKKLPEGCRVVFNLYLLEGYQHQEIASILDISESTSKTQYRRARQLLREMLDQ